MKNVKTILAMMMVAGLLGCTSNSTRQAIAGFRETQDGQQQLFDNTIGIAKAQMYVAMSEYMKLHENDPAAISAAAKAAMQIRDTLEESRVQYSLQRSKAELTVGQ